MAFAIYDKLHVVVFILIFISSSTCKYAKAYVNSQLGAGAVVADEYLPGAENEGGSSGYLPQGASSGTSPDVIFGEALECFDDKNIYSICEEAYRLNQGGELSVPSDYTDEYCNGPCITETQNVLACIRGVFDQFLFHNRATLGDIRDTIESGCSYGPKRGNFDVAEHIQANGASPSKLFNPSLYASLLLMCMIHNVFS
ncbi:hypothetical protein F511_40880 [Dorcoceras hygrometricum]|uniref:DUF7731 domain-containing protein n=1 Tax=Dorcoceras hygrometricum TaxID=472368 RepID=A0A2Z7AGM9_9LAMI|nr:hypothetical protein F511_40880 [Dorcoceras hygrometricum]